MRRLIRSSLALVASSVVAVSIGAEEPRQQAAPGTTIKQTDRYGNVQHHKSSSVLKDDRRIVEVSPYGQEQHHKAGFQAEGDRASPTDRYGNVQHDQSSWVVEKDGRIVEKDGFGNKQHHKPGFEVRGTEVYPTDRYGNRGKQTHEVKGRTPQPAPENGASKAKSSGK